MAERGGLENHCTGNGTGGSNPPVSAFGPPKQTYGVRQSVSGFAKATFATQIMYLFIH